MATSTRSTIRRFGAATAQPARLSAAAVRRSPRRTLTVLCAVAVVLSAAATGLSVAAAADGSVDAARAQALDAGQRDIATLLSYDHRTVDSARAERTDLVTGKFRDDYARLITDTVAPAAKARKLVTRTDVVSRSVIDGDSDHMNLLLFLNQASQPEGAQEPILSGSRVRVAMERVDGGWRVADMTPL